MSELTLASFLLATLVGLVVGTFSGLFGVGGGILMVPAFMYISQFRIGDDTHQAMATSLAAMVPIAIAGVARYAGPSTFDWKAPLIICAASLVIGTLLAKYLPQSGKVNFQLATAMAVGSIVGSFYLGVPIAQRIPADRLAKLFGLLIVILGLRMTGFVPWLLAHLPSRGQPAASP